MYEKLLERLVEELKGYFKDDLVSVVLYGSLARGEAGRYSDIDLLLLCESLPDERLKRQDIFLEIEDKLENELEELYERGYHPYLSPILKTRREAEKLSPLYLDMVHDALVLYDRDDFFKEVLERLRKRLESLRARKVRIGGKWYWDLKPDYKFGERIVIE